MGRWDKINERGKDVKKRNIAISILVGVCACFIGAGASACGGKDSKAVVGECELVEYDSESYCVIGVNNKACMKVEIPATYNGKPVVAIENAAFEYCSNLTSVTIPDSLTNIGEWAFYNCSGLTSIKYCGTQAQWNVISKGDLWDYNTGSYTITYDSTGN